MISSSLTIFQEVNSVLTAYQNSLNINHYHLPGRSVAAAVQEMNAYVTTAYVCLVGDDDFIVPAAITTSCGT